MQAEWAIAGDSQSQQWLCSPRVGVRSFSRMAGDGACNAKAAAAAIDGALEVAEGRFKFGCLYRLVSSQWVSLFVNVSFPIVADSKSSSSSESGLVGVEEVLSICLQPWFGTPSSKGRKA